MGSSRNPNTQRPTPHQQTHAILQKDGGGTATGETKGAQHADARLLAEKSAVRHPQLGGAEHHRQRSGYDSTKEMEDPRRNGSRRRPWAKSWRGDRCSLGGWRHKGRPSLRMLGWICTSREAFAMLPSHLADPLRLALLEEGACHKEVRRCLAKGPEGQMRQDGRRGQCGGRPGPEGGLCQGLIPGRGPMTPGTRALQARW